MNEEREPTKQVGLIGLGIMGGAIGANLIERGWAVVGYDIDDARCRDAAAAGVRIAKSVAEVAADCPVILTSLPTPDAASIVAREIAATSEPRIVAELSTFALSDKMNFKAALDPGGHFALDCPLSGTGAQARQRDLIVYASGDAAAIARCRPIFADFAKQSADLGSYGNGSRMKFIANLLVAIHNVAAAEAMVLAERAGLDLKEVIELIGPGAGGSRMFQMRAPMMAVRNYLPATMRVSTWQKDMSIISAFAAELGCATSMFDLTKPVYDAALVMGLGDSDTAAVFEVLKQRTVVARDNVTRSNSPPGR